MQLDKRIFEKFVPRPSSVPSICNMSTPLSRMAPMLVYIGFESDHSHRICAFLGDDHIIR